MPESDFFGGGKIQEFEVSPNLTVRALPSEHFGIVFDRNRDLYSAEIANSNGVIMEYFPQELHSLDSNFVARTVTSYDLLSIPFYGGLAGLAAEHGKDVFVVDPAHDLNFAVFRTPQAIAILGGGYLSYTSFRGFFKELRFRKEFAVYQNQLNQMQTQAEGMKMLKKEVRRKVKRQQRGQAIEIPQPPTRPTITSRRRFLGRLAKVALVLGGLPTIGVPADEIFHDRPTPYPSEQRFRRLVVAGGIVKLGDTVVPTGNQPNKLIAFYPILNWEGTMEFLNDRDKLRSGMETVQRIKPILPQQMRQSFFSIRQYSANSPYDGGWNPVHSLEI